MENMEIDYQKVEIKTECLSISLIGVFNLSIESTNSYGQKPFCLIHSKFSNLPAVSTSQRIV